VRDGYVLDGRRSIVVTDRYQRVRRGAGHHSVQGSGDADDYQRFDAGQEPRGLDKEYVRRMLANQGYRGEGPPPPLTDAVRVEAARRYIEVCELVTGRPFQPDTEEPVARIRRNLGP
jgi:hypothetical protein